MASLSASLSPSLIKRTRKGNEKALILSRENLFDRRGEFHFTGHDPLGYSPDKSPTHLTVSILVSE